MRSRVDSAFADTSYAVIAWRGARERPRRRSAYDFSTDTCVPSRLRVAAYRAPQWSEDGRTLFFGVAPREPKVDARASRARRAAAGARAGVALEGRAPVPPAGGQRGTGSVSARRSSRGTSARRRSRGCRDDPLRDRAALRERRASRSRRDEGPYAREYMSGRAVSRRLSRRRRDREAQQDSHQVALRRVAEPERPIRAVPAGRPVVVARPHERRAHEPHRQDQERRS